MKNKLIIHIGVHKTGTTSIQLKLDTERTTFLDNGIYYLKSNKTMHCHHKLAFALQKYNKEKNNPILHNQLKELSEELNSIDNNLLAVISSEELFTISLEAIYLLKEFLKEFDVYIIAFIRRQDNQFVSLYNEFAKRYKNNFIRPAKFYLKNPLLLSEELDYLKFLNQWGLVFGKEKISVKLYEDYTNVVQGFFDAIGYYEYCQDNTSVRKNISVSLEVLEILRQIKQITNDFSIRKKILDDAKMYFVNGTPPQNLITTDERRAVLDFFQQSNEELFKNYFNTDNKYNSQDIEIEKNPAKVNNLDITRFFLNYVKLDNENC